MTPQSEPASWIIHGEREIDATRRLRLSIASVELPDGVCFEHYVMRIPGASMCLLMEEKSRVLMLRRHRFIHSRDPLIPLALPRRTPAPPSGPGQASFHCQRHHGQRPRRGDPHRDGRRHRDRAPGRHPITARRKCSTTDGELHQADARPYWLTPAHNVD